MRLTLKRVEWDNDGKHKVQFYSLPLNARVPDATKNHLSANQRPSISNSQEENENQNHWFDLNRWSDASGRGRTDTLLPELDFESSASANSATEARDKGWRCASNRLAKGNFSDVAFALQVASEQKRQNYERYHHHQSRFRALAIGRNGPKIPRIGPERFHALMGKRATRRRQTAHRARL